MCRAQRTWSNLNGLVFLDNSSWLLKAFTNSQSSVEKSIFQLCAHAIFPRTNHSESSPLRITLSKKTLSTSTALSLQSALNLHSTCTAYIACLGRLTFLYICIINPALAKPSFSRSFGGYLWLVVDCF